MLMSCYGGDDPDFLERAVRSVTDEQTLAPSEMVLVVDGPLPALLQGRVEQVVARSSVPVRLVRLPVNSGLGPALNAGLAACAHEIVARMDADDVSMPHRFAVQVPLVSDRFDLLGSAITEFVDDPEVSRATRPVRTTESAIASGMRLRQSFNHPTVVFRASTVERVGGYQPLPSLEDYWLFARIVSSGARVGNVAEPLVAYRVGAGAYARRGGASLARSEWELQRRLRSIGFTTRSQFTRNVLVRVGYRIVPETVRRTAYRGLFTRSSRVGPGDPPGT